MCKHALDYHSIGNPPQEFPAPCILLDKGNGLRKFGLSRRREQTRRTIRCVEGWLCPSLAAWRSSGWGHCLCFAKADLHKSSRATGSWAVCTDALEPVQTGVNKCLFPDSAAPVEGISTPAACCCCCQRCLPAGSIPYPLC